MDRSKPNQGLTESFYSEMDVVFARHAALIRARPDLIVALLVNMADGLRSEFGVRVEVEDVDVTDEDLLADDHRDRYFVRCQGRGNEAAGMLGFDRDPDTGHIVEDDMAGLDLEYVD